MGPHARYHDLHQGYTICTNKQYLEAQIILDRQIIIGSYHGDSREDYYREAENIIRVRTEYGVMWVPLVTTGGAIKRTFNKATERVLVILINPDYTLNSLSNEDAVLASDDAFGIIIQLPPQYIREYLLDPEDEINMPTKLFTDSDSGPGSRNTFGTGASKVVASDDMIAIKGPGGQIAIGKDGIVTKGNVTNLNFFNESRGGILKENWLARILPPTVKIAIELATGTPMPEYLPDDKLIRKVAGITETIGGMT